MLKQPVGQLRIRDLATCVGRLKFCLRHHLLRDEGSHGLRWSSLEDRLAVEAPIHPRQLSQLPFREPHVLQVFQKDLSTILNSKVCHVQLLHKRADGVVHHNQVLVQRRPQRLELPLDFLLRALRTQDVRFHKPFVCLELLHALAA